MQEWATEELKQADLGDARRTKRLIRIVEDLSAQPASSVLQAYYSQITSGATRKSEIIVP